MKKALRSALRKSLMSLPTWVRHPLYRNMINVDYRTDSGLIIKIADTQSELEQAFTLLHTAYVKMGYMKADPSGMRVTFYHALPSTTTIVAKMGEEVVGTFSVIRDNTFGLPIDQIFDIGHFRRKGEQLAEISSLAVDPRFRNNGEVFFPLLKFIWYYCNTLAAIDRLVIAVNPSMADFYEALLLFEKSGRDGKLPVCEWRDSRGIELRLYNSETAIY